jgi:hypothetical protein
MDIAAVRGEKDMRVFLIACLATIVLAVGGFYALASVQKPTGAAYVTEGARTSPKWSWREVFSRKKAAPQNVAMAMPQSTEALAEDCDVSSAWGWIMADFVSSPTADTTCEK